MNLSLMNSIRKFLKEVSPIRLIVSSFFMIILVGTILLCLPISARNGESTNIIDSLFIATSTTCVTGLTVFDTWTKWSWFGQLVILLLIQLGGLGLVTFTSAFTLFFRRRLGLRDMQIATEYTNGKIIDTQVLIKTIVFWTLACEVIGSLILMIRFIPQFGPYGIWVSLFTSVSAYCNAGFDIMGFVKPGASLSEYSNDPIITITISLLIIIGGIGFLVITDVYSYFLKKFKNKMSHPRLSIHSNIVISTSIILLLLGTIMFMIFEYNNTLKGMSILQKLNVSFFQSSSARTAGFFAVPIGEETDVTKFITILLMFIGASPASTGGGIKTTTFVVLLATVKSVLSGHTDTIIMKHKVNKNTVYKSLTIVIIGLFMVFVAAITIDKIESPKNIPVLDIFFETVSAFATVGLTTGITEMLSNTSKFILSFAMFVGRVGPISLILALSFKSPQRTDTVLPDGRIVVG